MARPGLLFSLFRGGCQYTVLFTVSYMYADAAAPSFSAPIMYQQAYARVRIEPAEPPKKAVGKHCRRP